jgi:chemotaxis protein methyltransferase CheR
MSIRDEELQLFLIDLIDRYGYDFTEYSEASLKRRVDLFMVRDNIPNIMVLRSLVLGDPDYFRHLVEEMTVNVTEMLRDPFFYRAVREEVIPVLATHPFIRIWHAGCSTGEEVYSMAILLKEAGILQKSRLYATDINPRVIEKARNGIFPASQMRQYSENYMQSGGKNDFSSYYTANYNLAKFDESLSENMTFATHNLVVDSSFNEFQLILCRNTLIYFNKNLQSRVLELFDQSLELLGFLALGSKESLRFSSVEFKFRQTLTEQKIWRKVK